VVGNPAQHAVPMRISALFSRRASSPRQAPGPGGRPAQGRWRWYREGEWARRVRSTKSVSSKQRELPSSWVSSFRSCTSARRGD
jgi:hypothetical protein